MARHRKTLKGDALRLGFRLKPEQLAEIEHLGLDPNTATPEELTAALLRKEQQGGAPAEPTPEPPPER